MGSLVQAHPEAQARLFRSDIRDSLFWFCPINIAEVRVSRKKRGSRNFGSVEKAWGRFLNEGVFPASTYKDGCKYLRERMQVLAGTDAVHCGGGCSALRGRLQCTAGTDAVHCEDGCSALRGRLQCTASEMGKTGIEIVSCHEMMVIFR